VFLKGCPLRCPWCHNPEGISPGATLAFLPERCIGCGACLRVCPNGAHRLAGEGGEDGAAGHVLDRDRCTVCGACAEECYAGALELIGRDASVEEVMEQVLADRCFYETSGGGMTVSGGEPTYQVDFAAALLRRAKDEHVHTALETCGYAEWDAFGRLMPLTDLWLFDVKAGDDEQHRELTGVPLRPILDNLRRLHDAGADVVLRLPLIPGINAGDEHFRRIADLINSLPRVRRAEVLPYHPLGASKYARIGLPDPMQRLPGGASAPDEEEVRGWVERLRALGVPAERP
jgi:pyruvate formate lyase activating enzyme